MRAFVPATVLTAVAAAVMLPVGAASAAADTQAPKITSVSAPSVVVMTPKGATFDVTVKASDNVDISRVVVGLVDSTGKFGKAFVAQLAGGMSWEGTYRARITMPTTLPLGTWNVRALAEDNSGNQSAGILTVRDTFVLKNGTKIVKLRVNPEAVAKGTTVTVGGLLKHRVSSSWAPYAGKVVKIQFRKAGTGSWTNVIATTSRSTGRFSAPVKATAAGEWRAVYKGDATTMKATSGVDRVTLTG
jgi:hypothetical protein